MIGITDSFINLKKAPAIRHDILLVFGVNCVYFPICATLVKKRRKKKLCKSEKKYLNFGQFITCEEVSKLIELQKLLVGVIHKTFPININTQLNASQLTEKCTIFYSKPQKQTENLRS